MGHLGQVGVEVWEGGFPELADKEGVRAEVGVEIADEVLEEGF
jgi:hypothetical protein